MIWSGKPSKRVDLPLEVMVKVVIAVVGESDGATNYLFIPVGANKRSILKTCIKKKSNHDLLAFTGILNRLIEFTGTFILNILLSVSGSFLVL